MTAGPVNRALLESFFQSPGQVYDDAKTEGAFDVIADQTDDNWNYLSGLIGNTVPNPQGMARQALINGNFDFWQRGTVIINPANNAFTADRFFVRSSGSSGPANLSHAQTPATISDVPGSIYYLRLTATSSGASTFNYALAQTIENGTRNLANGAQITVSFWAKSSITGKKIGVRLYQNYGTTGSPTAEETINGTNFTLSTSWTRYTFTFTTNTLTGKTFGTSLNDFLRVEFGVSWDASNQATFGSSSAEGFSASGTVDLSQIAVSLGNAALPHMPVDLSLELERCQRYFEKTYDVNTAPGAFLANNGEIAFQTRTAVNALVAGTIYSGQVIFKTRKRSTPIITLYTPGSAINSINVAGNARTGATALTPSETGFRAISLDNTGAISVALDALIEFHYIASAELQ